MRKWGKKAWWSLGIAAAAMLLCVAIANLLFDQARMIAMVQERVHAALARDMKIGALSLRLIPYPALVAKQVTLSNPDWARDKNLLQADTVSAHLKLLPLFGGHIVVSAVSADGLKANLEVAKDGRKSWDFSRASTASGKLPFDPQQVTALQLHDAQINYTAAGAERKSFKIDELSAHAEPGWHKVQLEAGIARNGHRMQVNGQFADLARAGVKGAVSIASLEIQWGDAKLSLAGNVPLEGGLEGLALKADFQSTSMKDLLGFLAIKNGPLAPLKASAAVRLQQGWFSFGDLAIKLGELTVTGDAKLKLSGARPVFDARLAADRLDWAKTMSDIGRPPLPPKPPDELFRTNPLAWPVLVAMEGMDGTLDARIRNLTLRSGVELKEAKARMAFKGDRVQVNQYSANLLGGTAGGNAQLDGRRQSIRFNLDATDISLGEWLAERENKLALTGGPMKINASASASGASMKELAASLTGSFNIRMGPAKIQSQRLQDAETLLIGLAPMFSAKESDRVDLACVGARFQFVAGRAQAEPIVGARSEVSQILTSGYVDLREQTLDLRGRVKARSGVNLGVSTLAGDVKIAGKILHPEVGMDPAGTAGILARLGAAIATGGASLLITSIWDAANPASDPCQIVFTAPVRAAQSAAAGRAQVETAPAGP
jgi:uncharacterized protein involved in outer membrane biogenesis